MTITCDNATRGTLDGAVTKTDWANKLLAALGSSGRRVICKRDASSSAADPWTTGTIFRNVGASGAFGMISGKLSTLGRLKGTTVATAADMLSGKSVLRMQNADGTRWIMGTLGLSRKAQAAAGVAEANIVDYDFTVPKNFTATNGLGVVPNFALGGRRFLPSGVGPAAPALDVGAPTVYEMWDWANPASPVKTGAITLDTRAEDFLYEDLEMALENGDTAVYQSTQSLTLGEFEFGFTLLASSPTNTEAGNVPLYQVLGAIRSIKPSWSSYPASDTYDFVNDNVFLPPLKIVAKNSAGAVIHTFELQDGKAINDPTVTSAKQSWGQGLLPFRPKMNCYQMLPWQNTRPRASSKLNKFYPGLATEYRRPSMGKTHFSVNGCEPIFTDGYNQNGTVNGWANIYTVKQWPEKRLYKIAPAISDPYLSYYDLNHDTQQGTPWCEGWGYEPGSKSTHNWYTGPGGVRFDRAFIPSQLALWATDPNGKRLQDETPWRDMVDGFLLASFNHSNHLVRDVKKMTFTPYSDFKEEPWTGKNEYYSSGTEVAGPKVLRGNSDQRDGTAARHFDANGNMPFCGWGRDSQHNYANAGWGALLLNSPMHAIGSRWDYLYSIMQNEKPDQFNSGAYMYRNQAWEWLHLTIAWKLASRHVLGVSRADIEDRFVRKLEAIYRSVYVPAFIENSQSDYHKGIRNIGNPCQPAQYSPLADQGAWGYFLTGVLMLMRQCGLWKALMNKGGNVKTALLMQIRNMDRYCFDGLLDTTAIEWHGHGYWTGVPSSLAAWAAEADHNDGSDLFHNPDGSIAGDRQFGHHLLIQYVYMRPIFFPELDPTGRMAAAVAKLKGWMAERTAWVNAGTTPLQKMGRDSLYGLPGVAAMAAPSELGPFE